MQMFVGGTGSSGTTILAKVLAAHPDVMAFLEPRFLLDPGGMNDLICGKIRVEDFRANITEGRFLPLLARAVKDRFDDGYDYFSQPQVEKYFDESFNLKNKDIKICCKDFLSRLFEDYAILHGKKYWVEKTPGTVAIADNIVSIYPKAKFIHIIRNPFDVFRSMRKYSWGPDTVEQFISRWFHVMNQSIKQKVLNSNEQYLVISIENFATYPKEILTGVLEFLGIKSSDAIITNLATKVNKQRSHAGLWKKELNQHEIECIGESCLPLYQSWKQLEWDPKG